MAKVASPSDEHKRAAREVAEQARQASIVDDRRSARNLFKQAVQLDPTDQSTVYALARAYDEAKESRAAIAEYCRFLALAPNAPEANDVKGRVTSLTQDAARVRAEVATQLSKRPPRVVIHQRSDNSNVFALAAMMPGLGQYYTNRPLFGAAVTATSLGALYWGLQDRTRRVTTDSDHKTVVERRNLASGVTAAVGVSVLAAIEAYLHSHGTARAPKQADRTRTSLLLIPDQEQVRVGVSVPLAR